MASGLRWLSVVFACAISFALASCDLNPQPEVPGADDTAAGGSDSVGGEVGNGGDLGWGGAAGEPSPGGGSTRLDDEPNQADPNGFANKNDGNHEGPVVPGRPPPPDDQRPTADAGADAHGPPVVTM